MSREGTYHTIRRVAPGSIAEELELVPGDVLLSINGQEVGDVFDYQYLVSDDFLVLLVRKADGEEWELEIEKEYDEDLGLEFENGLMDEYRSCCNRCMFCFIDQMPPGMRETLYFKDDDSRLSFLQGNYVTLTNMKDRDLDRIIAYHLAPINISVHTTNPKLRCTMLGNRFAGEALRKIDRLYEAGIQMNGQIVLCKGVNDGEELDRTIGDLVRYLPHMESLSVVPVGLTRFRDGLYPLEPFGREEARQVIGIIERWQDYCMERHGVHFVQASDEWYLTAELPLPEEGRYDGYLQLENGVGMLRLLVTEFAEALDAYVRERGSDAGAVRFRETDSRQRAVSDMEGGQSREKESVSLPQDGEEGPQVREGESVPLPQDGEEEPQAGEKESVLLSQDGVEGPQVWEKESRSLSQENGNNAFSGDYGTRNGMRPGYRTTIATGRLAAPFIERMAADFMAACPEAEIVVVPIRNDFFGERITVSGLVTGQDLIAQLRGRKLGGKVAVPSNMLRMGEEVFLDDVTVSDVEKALQVPLDIVKSSGWDLLEAMAAAPGKRGE